MCAASCLSTSVEHHVCQSCPYKGVYRWFILTAAQCPVGGNTVLSTLPLMGSGVTSYLGSHKYSLCV